MNIIIGSMSSWFFSFNNCSVTASNLKPDRPVADPDLPLLYLWKFARILNYLLFIYSSSEDKLLYSISPEVKWQFAKLFIWGIK